MDRVLICLKGVLEHKQMTARANRICAPEDAFLNNRSDAVHLCFVPFGRSLSSNICSCT